VTESSATYNASTDMARQLAATIAPVFATDNVTTGLGDGRMVRLQGHLLTDSQAAYDYIAAHLKDYGYTALLRQAPSSPAGQGSEGRVVVVALPGLVAARPSREPGAIVLFVLTVLSVLYAGALMEAPDYLWPLTHPLAGVPFATGLLGILIAHELGHYLVSRRLGVAASLPYFIPMPFNLFGTMGAIIRTREPMRNRRQVLAIGAAGPLAGLLVAIPMLIVGLMRSTVQLISVQPGALLEGNSILYAALKFLVFGRFLPGGGQDVFLHPVAFGAWAALFVTGLNLFPAGQLDGGHVAYALFGSKAVWVSRLAVVVTLALVLVWSGWWLFAVLLFVFGQRHADPLDEITPLTRREKLLAVGMLLVFVLLFMPVPMTIL
jgi:membrane-associated protease RseP (regulator of RpoE activity)